MLTCLIAKIFIHRSDKRGDNFYFKLRFIILNEKFINKSANANISKRGKYNHLDIGIHTKKRETYKERKNGINYANYKNAIFKLLSLFFQLLQNRVERFVVKVRELACVFHIFD